MASYVASCFISYNHADADLAAGIADGLRSRGYYVWIDEGQLKVGDSLIGAIGEAIDRVDFLVALVSDASVGSDWCQKEISLAMTGEINRRGISVLPCRVGSVQMPPSLLDKLYLSVNAAQPDAAANELDRHMRLHLEPQEAIPPRRSKPVKAPAPRQQTTSRSWDLPKGSMSWFDPHSTVRMTGVDLNGITTPRNDGSRGSALYRVPITIEPTPDRVWAELFVQHWDRPSRFTTMHRPGIASVLGNKIVLDGTTMDELERYHMDTLRLAVDAANRDRAELAEREEAQRRREAEFRDAQKAKAAEIATRLKFD